MSDSDPSELIQQFRKGKAQSLAAAAKNPNFRKEGPGYEAQCKQWARRDFWKLHEAANLLCGTAPLRPQIDAPEHLALNQQVDQMRALIERAAISKQGTFSKQYSAKELVAWAIKKEFDVPEALQRAMGLKPPAEDKPLHGNARKNAQKREAVLGAAVAALVKFHPQCLDRGGKVSAKQIATVIEQHQDTLFKDGVAPLTVDTMSRLIRDYLKD